MKQKESDVTEVTRNTYDAIAAGYSQKIKDLVEDSWIGKYERALLDKFIGLIPAAEEDKLKVLDIGCGYGKDTFYLSRQKGITAVGLDYSQGMLAEAQEAFPGIDFVQMDMRSLLFPGNSFGGVWANGCIYHIPKKDIKLVLAEVRRVLKSSGVFLFNFKLGNVEKMEQNPKSYGGKPRFYSYYETEEMKVLITESGLRMIESVPYPEEIFGEKITHIWALKQ
jgi:ubiquinone/menaquinone biosynthesis C-methylase UbiE